MDQQLRELVEQAYKRLNQADVKGAQSLLEKALRLAEATTGTDRLDIAGILNDLGSIHRQLRDLPAAERYFQQSLKIHRAEGSKDDPRLAITLQHLGRLAQWRRDNTSAWEYWTEELEIWKRLKNPAYGPEVADCLHACGQVMADNRQYDQARRNFEQALGIREAHLPPNHQTIAESLADLGHLCGAMGDFAAAQGYLKRALPLFTNGLGPQHPEVKNLQARLGDAERALRRQN